MVKKIILSLVLIFGLSFIFHNAYQYPVDAGYDAWLHMRYAKIISHHWRIPDLTETREAYNPPLFYLTSGLVGRLTSNISGQDFFVSLKAWQYVSVFLAAISLYLWLLIVKKLHPHNQPLQAAFVLLLFSLPVFHKTIVMFSIESFFLFTVSLAFWYLITQYLPQPTIKKTIILALIAVINLLTRLSALVLFITLITALMPVTKKISVIKKSLKPLLIFCLVCLLGAGWFYFGSHRQDIYGVGEGGEPDIAFFKRQPLAFYTDIPFRLIITHPIRISKHTPLNRLIPIYYSELWGDWWNYYSQRRFNVSVEARKQDHYLTTSERVASLALQNQLNLFPTLLIISGFIYSSEKTFDYLLLKFAHLGVGFCEYFKFISCAHYLCL